MPETRVHLEFTRRLEKIGIPYMVTGGVAAISYGEPRYTNDVGIVARLARDRVPDLLAAFPETEFYAPPAEVIHIEIARGQKGHFNLIHFASSFKADIYLQGRDPLDAWALERAERETVGGESFALAPREYVIIGKLEFYRIDGSDKHIRDIHAILWNKPNLEYREDMEQWIVKRGLADVWAKVLKEMT